MKAHLLLPHSLSPRQPNSHSLIKRSLPRAHHPSPSLPLAFLRKTSRQFNPFTPGFEVVQAVRFEGPLVDVKDFSQIEDEDLVVETIFTKTLPPALTIGQGLEGIREAVEKLKLAPPYSSTGVLRFQVAVPPSAKALKWFCCQPELSKVFPIFFLSKDKDNPTFKSLYFNETRGVFGMGAAIQFANSISFSPAQGSLVKRYLTNDSTPITAYGFMNISFKDSSSMMQKAGNSYFFVPQVELDEYEGFSVLAATLAWSEYTPCTFDEAVGSLELSLHQASIGFSSSMEKFHSSYIRTSLRALHPEDTNVPMVYIRVASLAGRDFRADTMEMKEALSSSQFCFRHSQAISLAYNMLDHASEMCYSEREHANINAVWASLIIEECSRLGLTYFCIAPGSRSSPLAVAASSHPLITCIVCFDERSLAFHAVGYARGSHKPAAVITSSGTAVSNLLPAVVEASQDFVPLLLLTADRPPELQDAGSNQSVNQVNHFGSFVRYFFSLPAPTDEIPARMVLTTLDSSIHWATSSPCGPVHINCPFRDPLENSPSHWTLSCLKGLDFWMYSAKPFTKYIQLERSHACSDTSGYVAEVLNLIQGASNGLLLIGAIHAEDEIWAAVLLAKLISWPVVADILSGLRLRKILTSFSEIEKNFLFVDHLDHALLSDTVRKWLEVDVIVQVGSRITSKRISKMIEECRSCSYVMIDKHPARHDPSHTVTHRIESTVTEFVDLLLKAKFPYKRSKRSTYLQAMNLMVSWEIAFQICASCSLTEPEVAQVTSEALLSDSALFLGNSMPIRDADMYAHSWSKCTENMAEMMLNVELPFHWTRVAGNRGASGIDGLLSTAVGFAIGSNKRVLCVVGDVSFLHDTNGLAILNQRLRRKPVTVLVINNHGGAIFSLLPIADRVEPQILDKYFVTSHNIAVRSLCMAHGLKHLQVQSKMELRDALFTSADEEMDCIIEVESSVDANATFHSILRKFSCQAVDHGFGILARLSSRENIACGYFLCKISKMEYSMFRIQLCAPPTTVSTNHDVLEFYREGFILSLFLEDGSVGIGEVSPLEIHRENLQDVEEQLKCLLHVIGGAKISIFLPLLKGSFSSWIWRDLGIPPCSIFPSVRCGLEMAVLNAIARRQGSSSLLNTLHHQIDEGDLKCSAAVKVCALLDSKGTPAEVGNAAKILAEEGFSAIKVKVARQGSVIHDAAVIQEVRKNVGSQIELRVDANRNWSYEEAILFGSLVKDCGLQYVEEPVMSGDDIIRFCDESGLPVALDETIDNIQGNPLKELMKYAHPGIVAIVIKPSVVGGFENAALVAKWAQQQGKMAVISAAFESGVALSAYIHLSCYLELQNAETHKLMKSQPAPSIAHGLGTFRWLKEDVAINPLSITKNPHCGIIEASVSEANQFLQKFQINQRTICGNFTEDQVHTHEIPVQTDGFTYLIKVQEIGKGTEDSMMVFLHGFLGTGEDWITIMKSIAGLARCISVDLPGHGGSKRQKHGTPGAQQEPSLSVEVMADILLKLVNRFTTGKVNIVGYSMGARIALFMALRFSDKIEGAVILSGSPGLEDKIARKVRRAKDDSRARFLISYGLQTFLDLWYAGELWTSLRGHPHFSQIVSSRLQHDDLQSLAEVLSESSIGRQPSLWEELKHCKTSLMIIVGEKDTKFKTIARRILSEVNHNRKSKSGPEKHIPEMVEIPNSGHAAHLENPLALISALSKFIRSKKNSNSTS